jgi:hypothetical protein
MGSPSNTLRSDGGGGAGGVFGAQAAVHVLVKKAKRTKAEILIAGSSSLREIGRKLGLGPRFVAPESGSARRRRPSSAS